MDCAESLKHHTARRSIWPLGLLGATSLVAYLAIERLSRRFVFGEGHEDRPILAVLGLLAVAFACYVCAVWFGLRPAPRAVRQRRLRLTLGFAFLFRAVLLVSQPIQEIDIYRYLWDGRVAAAGISPFRFSPSQVQDAENARDSAQLPPELAKLIEVRDSSPAQRTIFQRVHYPEVPTVYPPVSQWVFAAAAWVTPPSASLGSHILAMKFVLVAFDVGTLWLLVLILRLVGKPVEWCVVYAWCPLVLKEIANSGHLDTIAVCLTTLAVYLLIRGNSVSGLPHSETTRPVLLWHVLAAAAWSLATMAKLYPVVLLAVFARYWWTQLRARAWVPLATYAMFTTLIAWPLLRESRWVSVSRHSDATEAIVAPVPFSLSASDAEPGPAEFKAPHVASSSSLAGLETFFSRWEMNDFLFMLVVENLKRPDPIGEHATPWFVLLPAETRTRWNESLEQFLGPELRHGQNAFWLARVLTRVVFVCISLWLALRRWKAPAPTALARGVFLSLAWLWLLIPTQNPWYWLWALPFVPFARQRSWLVLSGLALAYYLRFWFEYHFANSMVPGTSYRGTEFFDFVIVWLGYAPWLAALAVEVAFLRTRQSRAEMERG